MNRRYETRRIPEWVEISSNGVVGGRSGGRIEKRNDVIKIPACKNQAFRYNLGNCFYPSPLLNTENEKMSGTICDNQSTTKSIALVGVGGQGILLASEICAQAAMACGFDVKTNEVHGMAQRGGSVVAQIRYGKQVYSPLIAPGTASVLVALERIEALRYYQYLSENGLAVVNAQRIVPVTVSMGAAAYPEDAQARLEKAFSRLIYLEAEEIAEKLGNAKAANTVLLGAMATELDIPEDAWQKAIQKCCKPKFVDVNLAAFQAGQQAVTR